MVQACRCHSVFSERTPQEWAVWSCGLSEMMLLFLRTPFSLRPLFCDFPRGVQCVHTQTQHSVNSSAARRSPPPLAGLAGAPRHRGREPGSSLETWNTLLIRTTTLVSLGTHFKELIVSFLYREKPFKVKNTHPRTLSLQGLFPRVRPTPGTCWLAGGGLDSPLGCGVGRWAGDFKNDKDLFESNRSGSGGPFSELWVSREAWAGLGPWEGCLSVGRGPQSPRCCPRHGVRR